MKARKFDQCGISCRKMYIIYNLKLLSNMLYLIIEEEMETLNKILLRLALRKRRVLSPVKESISQMEDSSLVFSDFSK